MRLIRQGIVLLSVWCSLGVSAGTVRLRESAAVPSGQPVRLGDVAVLEGEDVQALSEVVLGATGTDSRMREVTLAQVREALDARSVNWGRIALSGSRCTVRMIGALQPEILLHEDEQVRKPGGVDLGVPPTVRTRVAMLLARLFGVSNESMRVMFDAKDKKFLSIPEWGRRIELQPNSVGSSSRQSVTVRVYEGEQLIESRTLRADVTVQRRVVVMRSSLGRRVVIGAGDVAMEELWMPPDGAMPVMRLDEAVGMLTQTRVSAGGILRTSDVEQPLLVKRGERVTVHCINGGIALRVQARALRDGKRGELIECALEGRDRSFAARVSDHGVAVMVLDAPLGDVE